MLVYNLKIKKNSEQRIDVPMAPLNKNVALKMQLQKVPHCIKALVLKQKYRFYLYEIMKKKECAAAKSKWIGDITSFFFFCCQHQNKQKRTHLLPN